MTDNRPAPLPKTGILGPDGEELWLGPIQKIHEVGVYKIVEYLRDMSNTTAADYSGHGKSMYEPWIGDENTKHSFYSLDEALVAAVAYRRKGIRDMHAAMTALYVFNLTTLGIIPDEN